MGHVGTEEHRKEVYQIDPEEMLDVIQVYYAKLFGGEEQQQQTSVQRDGRALAKERK